MAMRHLLSLLELTAAELKALLAEAQHLKDALGRGERPALLAGRVLGMIFEKPSLRTRASFEAAMGQLGGGAVFFGASDNSMGQRESVADFARVLSQYADAVVLRTFHHRTVEEFAACSRVPVINGLSDLYHPCQALGDLLTIQEVCGNVAGRTIVFIGDGNNVARSLAIGCGLLGARFILAAPAGYGFDPAFLGTYRQRIPQGQLTLNGAPAHAVGEADIIYTDVWTSMGQEAEQELRRRHFADFQVNASLLALAPPRVRVMHCLPAHRGEEITDDVLEGERSVVFQQAANRLHAQKALLRWLIGGK
jgi:ornithine carbamoyltransferase